MFRTRLSAATTAKRHKTDAPGGNGDADIILFKRIAAYTADFAGGKYTYRNKKARNGKRGFPFFVLYIGMPGAVFCISVNKQTR